MDPTLRKDRRGVLETNDLIVQLPLELVSQNVTEKKRGE